MKGLFGHLFIKGKPQTPPSKVGVSEQKKQVVLVDEIEGTVSFEPNRITADCAGRYFCDLRIKTKHTTERDTFRVDITGENCLVSKDGLNFQQNYSVHLRNPEKRNGKFNTFENIFYVRKSSSKQDKLIASLDVPNNVRLTEVSQSWSSRLRASNKVSSHDEEGDENFDVVIYTTAGAMRSGHLPLRSEMIAKALFSHELSVLYAASSNVAEHEVLQKNDQCILAQTSIQNLSKDSDRYIGKNDKGIFICSSRCDATALRLASQAKLRGWRVVYEVRDDMQAMRKLGFAQYYDPSVERAIARISDVIIVVSTPLKQKLIAWGIPENRISVIQNGASDDELRTFSQVSALMHLPRKKRAVYYGHLFPGRTDYDLIRTTAEANPDYQFHLYGPGYDPSKTKMPENVSYFGQVDHSDFFAREISAEIGLLPFRPNGMTFSLSPLKMAQYYAIGLKVVSSDIFELRSAPLTFCNPSTSFLDNFSAATKHKASLEDVEKVRRYLEHNQWTKIVDRMLSLIGVEK